MANIPPKKMPPFMKGGKPGDNSGGPNQEDPRFAARKKAASKKLAMLKGSKGDRK